MTKFTKERLEEIAELARKATYKPCAMHMTNLLAVCDSEVIEEMARQLLASMEQDPVAYMHHSGQVVTREECCDDKIFAICCKVETPLYAAPQLPQPAPEVTADDCPAFIKYDVTDVAEAWSRGHNQCRAAMLQGAEQQSPQQNIPENIPTLRDGLAAIRSLGGIDAGKIQAERDALNEPTCWCRTCRPVTMTDMRFVVCPECGNKRCPHANDHRNVCSGSNEPGQEGSAYPAAPQQEVK